MILDNSPYLVAFLITASIHLAWSSIPHAIHQQFLLLVSARSSAGVNIIKLHAFALLLLASSLSFKAASAASDSDSQVHQTYDFDDLKTTNGLGYIHSHNLLTFAGFSVMAPQDPDLPYIQPSDRNCAVSSPNALLGSRYGPKELRPTIIVNSTATRLKEVHAFFDLNSISVKPLAMPVDSVPVTANVLIRGWNADGEETDDPLVFRVEWTSGYSEPLVVDFGSKHFSENRWEALGLLDLSVDFGPDLLDWEFCLDDLRVIFTKCDQDPCPEDREKHSGKKQADYVPKEELR